jgi:tripartite-type tricarboxylate transporter receptor subunit TctC
MKMKRNFCFAVVLALSFSLLSLPVSGAEYPEKEIKFLAGVTPGSFADLCARALSKVSPKYLKKPLVVVNMPGANQTLAQNELAKSPPDGYTISMVPSDWKAVTAHVLKVPLDPKLLRTVLGFTEFRMTLCVGGNSPYASLDDFVAYGLKNQGAITYGHAGRGSIPHLMGLLFFRSAKVEAIDVPYTGGTIRGVLGSHVTSAIVDTYGLKQLVDAKQVRILTVFLTQRHVDYPNVPTSQEKGFVDLGALNAKVGVAIHKDTPPDRVKTLHDALKKTVEDAEFAKLLYDMNMKGGYISPDAYDESISKLEKLTEPLLKELNLYAH